MTTDGPLRVALLTYRGHPYTGGQGVYVRHLSRELAALGHEVEVLSGPPYPHVDSPPRLPAPAVAGRDLSDAPIGSVRLTQLPSLDLYRMPDPFRFPKLAEFRSWIDVLEYAQTCTASFAEPLTFSLRAHAALRRRADEFDIVHDNQCLGYGIDWLRRAGMAVMATIHHPITVDRRVETAHAPTAFKRFCLHRFYAFTKMQSRVARRLDRIVTVSRSSRDDIVTDHGVDPARVHVVPAGVDTSQFRPLRHVEQVPGRLMTTASADVAMKGLAFLLEALAKLRADDNAVHLVVVGAPKEDSAATRMIDRLGLRGAVEFTSKISDERLTELYSQAELAVVPSLYEGFSLPAIEAMSCGVPLIATTGGALSEVTGADGETCLQVPAGDADALASRIRDALGRHDLRRTVGAAGRQRVQQRYSWAKTAQATAEHYRALLGERAAAC